MATRVRRSRQMSMIHDVHHNCHNCPSSLSCPPVNGFIYPRSVSMASIDTETTAFACNEHEYPHMHPLSDKIRRKIRVFKMNPIQKWRYQGKIPWKLMIQAAKIIFVTIQLIVFGNRINRHFKHHGNTLALMKEMFLTDADLSFDLQPYPPNVPQAVHNRAEFYEHINKAISVYSTIDRGGFGVYSFGQHVSEMNPISPLTLCLDSYESASLDPGHFFYNYSLNCMHRCIDIFNESWTPSDPMWQNFSIQHFLKSQNAAINFRALSQAVLSFPLRAIFINSLEFDDPPDCYEITVSILYDNSLHDGRMTVTLTTKNHQRSCQAGMATVLTTATERYILTIIVLIICSLSCISCLKSLFHAYMLHQETDRYFTKYFRKEMTWSERLFFVDTWIPFTILNDCLVISGTSIKLLLEKRIYESSYFSTCSMLMGVGTLFVWFGIMRYLVFFNIYNILILAIKTGIAYFLRFLSAVMSIYIGYVLCGWLVLSPFHIKFQHLSSTSETLFSLANGDDMFVTFQNLNAKDDVVVWYFCRIFIYSWVVLFMFIVASQVIAIFSLSFDTINHYYANGFPRTPLEQFIQECPMDGPDSSRSSAKLVVNRVRQAISFVREKNVH